MTNNLNVEYNIDNADFHPKLEKLNLYLDLDTNQISSELILSIKYLRIVLIILLLYPVILSIFYILYKCQKKNHQNHREELHSNSIV